VATASVVEKLSVKQLIQERFDRNGRKG